MTKKKRPLIERDTPTHSPEGLAKVIEEYLTQATRDTVELKNYTVVLSNGLSFTWSKDHGTRS